MTSVWNNPVFRASFRSRGRDLVEAFLTSSEEPPISEPGGATVVSLNGLPTRCQVVAVEKPEGEDETLLVLRIPGWQGLTGEENAAALEYALYERGEHPNPDAVFEAQQ